MGHYAKIDENNIVTEVIVAKADYINSLEDSSSYIKTSYNTLRGVHYQPSDTFAHQTPSEDQSKSLRKNYAGIGYTYDSVRDAFIAPRPIDRNGVTANSWVLNETTCCYEPPIPIPDVNELLKDSTWFNANMEEDPTEEGAYFQKNIYVWDETVHQNDTGNPKTLGWVLIPNI
tara:strand:- start:95 stop:613 length:519 start_codon:yes stop_codon:yes gene_type:complete